MAKALDSWTLVDVLDEGLEAKWDGFRQASEEEVESYRRAKEFGDMPAYVVVKAGEGTGWFLVYRNNGNVPLKNGENPLVIREGEEKFNEDGAFAEGALVPYIEYIGGPWAKFVEALYVPELDHRLD
ncbi:MAG: hypothetical protein ACXQT2_05130 [Methanotrichaceae archaeon]